jgi:adenine-specific DNA methylase
MPIFLTFSIHGCEISASNFSRSLCHHGGSQGGRTGGDPYRHGGKEGAEAFFLGGMGKAIHQLAEQAHPAFPVTIYYAFKQSETKDHGTSSAGWETFCRQ